MNSCKKISTSIAKFCTERKLPEVPLERSQGTVETKSEPDFRQKYTVEKNVSSKKFLN